MEEDVSLSLEKAVEAVIGFQREGEKFILWAGKCWAAEELIARLQDLLVQFGESYFVQASTKNYTQIACPFLA